MEISYTFMLSSSICCYSAISFVKLHVPLSLLPPWEMSFSAFGVNSGMWMMTGELFTVDVPICCLYSTRQPG